VEGTLAADGKSLRELLRWSGRQELPGGGFGPFRAQIASQPGARQLPLSGTNIELDGNVAEGVLAVSTEPRMTVKGTLAADALDLTPTFPPSSCCARTSATGTEDRSPSTACPISISIFASRLRASPWRRPNSPVPALPPICTTGRLTLAIGEAQVFGGSLKGAMVLGQSKAGADVKSQLQFTRCRSGFLPRRAVRHPPSRRQGQPDARDRGFGIQRAGADPHGWRETANLTARQGGITGFNVEQLLKRLEQRPLSWREISAAAARPFELLNVNAAHRTRHRDSRTCAGQAAVRCARRLPLDPGPMIAIAVPCAMRSVTLSSSNGVRRGGNSRHRERPLLQPLEQLFDIEARDAAWRAVRFAVPATVRVSASTLDPEADREHQVALAFETADAESAAEAGIQIDIGELEAAIDVRARLALWPAHRAC